MATVCAAIARTSSLFWKISKHIFSFVLLKANQLLWQYIFLYRVKVKSILFPQTPKRQKKTCIAPKHKMKNWFLLSVRWWKNNHNVFEYHIPSFPLTVHATAAVSACGDSGRASRKRGRSPARGRSRFLASTPLWAPLPLNSNGGSVPDLVLHRICWRNVNGEGVWSVECGVVEVQCSAVCFAHTGALLLHSSLSCRVMDLLPAAYGTRCTESAQAVFYSQHKTSEIYAG